MGSGSIFAAVWRQTKRPLPTAVCPRSMTTAQQLDTHEKALAINLDRTIVGSFAEIGAGQEVARWFLSVGAASGTVAKTISAYHKAVSDDLYGAGSRYVSKPRLEAMLDREWEHLLNHLQPSSADTRFFSFANTVAARNFEGTNECHGWMGIRFQLQPYGAAQDVLLHVNLIDQTNLLQQQALGIAGVNLIHAVFHSLQCQEDLLDALLDQAGRQRIEIDFIEARGPAFESWHRNDLTLGLVRQSLAQAVVFAPGRLQMPPTEVFRKKPVVLVLASDGAEPTRREILATAVLRLRQESDPAAREPLGLFVSSPGLDGQPDHSTPLLSRVDALLDLGAEVAVFSHGELYRIASFVNRYTHAPVRFVVGVSSVIQLFSEARGTLEGRLLEALSKLFAQNVRAYVYPMTAPAVREALSSALLDGWHWKPTDDEVSVEALQAPTPLSHLLSYLLATNFIVPMRLIS